VLRRPPFIIGYDVVGEIEWPGPVGAGDLRGDFGERRIGPSLLILDRDLLLKQTIAERSKDGIFVFHDPKLDTDLNLVFDKIGIVRGMEGFISGYTDRDLHSVC
jgi:hypothetical protein